MIAKLIILLGLLVLFTPVYRQRGGTVMGPFQILAEKEMDGVPSSWAGKINPRNPSRPILVADKHPITYYGHGLPLKPVEPGPLLHPLKMAHNSSLAVLPECCPSPYSTDRGCLCGAIEDIMRA